MKLYCCQILIEPGRNRAVSIGFKVRRDNRVILKACSVDLTTQQGTGVVLVQYSICFMFCTARAQSGILNVDTNQTGEDANAAPADSSSSAVAEEYVKLFVIVAGVGSKWISQNQKVIWGSYKLVSKERLMSTTVVRRKENKYSYCVFHFASRTSTRYCCTLHV